MIKKLIIVIILSVFCFGFSIQDAHKAVIARKNVSAADPCTTMGASGTYELWANGEYPGDEHYACKDSGTGVDATAEVAGVAVAGGAITGNIGYLLNAADEYVRWAAPSGTIDADGTIEFKVTTPAAFNHHQALIAIYGDGNDNIQIYFNNDNDRLYGKRTAGDGATTTYVGDADSAVSTGTTYTVKYTWQTTGTDQHEIHIDGVEKDDDTEDCGVLATSPSSFSIGDDFVGIGSGTDIWKVDDVQFREGFEGD